MIHVCFGLHDKTGRYSKFTGTAMLSMFENTNSKITVHILHDNTLSTDNREKFIYLAGQYGQLVEFYNVEELCADKIAEYVNIVPSIKDSRVSIGAFYRLLTHRILPTDINKCIYLDSDIIVNLDISELQRVILGNKPLAAVPEIFADSVGFERDTAPRKYLLTAGFVKKEDNFNSGVLVMNLKYFRDAEKDLINGVIFRGNHPECDCFDQDILNYLFSKKYVKLSNQFNKFSSGERYTKSNAEIRQVIYHYSGATWGNGVLLNTDDNLNRLWMKYFIKTPWFDEESIGRLYAGVQQLHVGLKQAMVNLSAIMSGKTRGFFVAPNDVDGLKRFFAIREDEEIILAENQDSLNKLIDAMNNSRGRKVFFIMLPNFPFKILIQAGFAPGKDFVNGFDFLSEAQGVPLNSYPLIQAM